MPLKPVAYIVIGGLLANTLTATANLDVVDSLTRAFENIAQRKEAKQEEVRAKLPNALPCESMGWMGNCNEINNQQKRNPLAHIQAKSRSGTEMNFPPGTSSADMRHALEQSLESAIAVREYRNKVIGEAQLAADLMRKAAWVTGPMEHLPTIDELLATEKVPLNINTSNLDVSFFTSSTCSTCGYQLSALNTLRKKYPFLKIRVYQMDNNRVYQQQKLIDEGYTSRILSTKEILALSRKGVTDAPALFIDNQQTKTRQHIPEFASFRRLEKHLQAAAYIKTAQSIEGNQ
ncbi:MAG: hypothetical protein V3T17_09820 [Pseudomonadales bacterium]